MKHAMKKVVTLVVVFTLALGLIGCGKKTSYVGELYLLNFGDYMDPGVIDKFEEETNIKVYQDLFEANEEVLPVIESGAKYDLICISDYCIEKLIGKNLLEEIDKTKITNYENLNKEKLALLSVCDNKNLHAIPYFTGTIGIFFNKTLLDNMGVPYPTKFADLWNPKLKGGLLMQSSIRDLYTVALKKNGFSGNSTNKEELEKCTNDFIEQKPYVSGYMCDQIKEKFINGECAIAPITSGDVQYVYNEGGEGDYCFIVPEEGTVPFIDAWCMLKNADNKENGYLFMDFLLREDIARLNADYVGYESVNDKTPDSEFLHMRMEEGRYYDYSTPEKNELERDVGDAISYYSDGYNKIKAS